MVQKASRAKVCRYLGASKIWIEPRGLPVEVGLLDPTVQNGKRDDGLRVRIDFVHDDVNGQGVSNDYPSDAGLANNGGDWRTTTHTTVTTQRGRRA
jgi:hypothetical protein